MPIAFLFFIGERVVLSKFFMLSSYFYYLGFLSLKAR